MLVVAPFSEAHWKWLQGYFRPDEYDWEFLTSDLLAAKQPLWLPHALKCAERARRCDLVVSHLPYMTLWLSVAMRLLRVKTPHLAASFNHGNKRFFWGPFLAMARIGLPKVELFSVYSNSERHLYHDRYGIPLDRLSFCHWAVRPPVVSEVAEDTQSPYACCIGRNNRDFDTLLRAVEPLPFRIVIVCRKGALQSFSVPSNVTVKENVSLDECMRILAGSEFSIVPLIDAETGAGHMTIVSAMQLGKAQIITRAKTVEDYFIPQEHGLFVPFKDPDALRNAISQLHSDVVVRRSMGEKAKRFADQWFSEDAAARSLRAVLDAWKQGSPWPTEPPAWSEVSGRQSR